MRAKQPHPLEGKLAYLTGSHGRLAPRSQLPGYAVDGKTYATATAAWQAALAVCSDVSAAAKQFNAVRLAMLAEVNGRPAA